jgi:AraC-like DNA-binding protein
VLNNSEEGGKDMHPEKIEFVNNIPVKLYVRRVEQYPYHWHDTLEIIQVLKGSINVSLGNDDLMLRENDIAVINVGELHRIIKGQDDNEIMFIQIRSGFYRNLLPDSRYLFIYCCSTYHEAEVPERYEKVREHIAHLVSAYDDNLRNDCKKNIKNILADMLSYVTYNFDFLRWGYGTVAFDEKRVERLKQIAEHTSSDLEVKMGLKDMASEAGVSLQHLSNDIKDKFGLTFQELLYYSKCEHAAKLLLSTDGRIVDIAMECGFSDPKYLIKHFKKNFGHTPSEFRKMYRTDDKALYSLARYHDLPLSEATRNLNK